MADVFVGSLRHADPIRINVKLIGEIAFMFLIVAAVLVWGRRTEKAWERQEVKFQEMVNARNAGIHYYYGYGVPRDRTVAAQYFEKAARGGDGFSANQLAAMYETADGLPQDYGKAVEWYRVAVREGDLDAAINLGRAYENGMGVQENLKQAEYWYSLAANAGNQDAKDSVKRLRSKR
jgi:hypothetical protein